MLIRRLYSTSEPMLSWPLANGHTVGATVAAFCGAVPRVAAEPGDAAAPVPLPPVVPVAAPEPVEPVLPVAALPAVPVDAAAPDASPAGRSWEVPLSVPPTRTAVVVDGAVVSAR